MGCGTGAVTPTCFEGSDLGFRGTGFFEIGGGGGGPGVPAFEGFGFGGTGGDAALPPAFEGFGFGGTGGDGGGGVEAAALLGLGGLGFGGLSKLAIDGALLLLRNLRDGDFFIFWILILHLLCHFTGSVEPDLTLSGLGGGRIGMLVKQK